MKLSEAVKKVLALTQAIRDYWDEELPKRHPDYPFVQEGVDDGPPPPEEKKLKELFARLPDEQFYQIVLLMHLGRGSIRVEDLKAGYEWVRAAYKTRADVLPILLGGALLDELTFGLEKLERAKLGVDEAVSLVGA